MNQSSLRIGIELLTLALLRHKQHHLASASYVSKIRYLIKPYLASHYMFCNGRASKF